MPERVFSSADDESIVSSSVSTDPASEMYFPIINKIG
jgi:hypothetical protein